MPLELLAELFAHEAWADSELLHAVSAHPQAVSDALLTRTIQHIIVVQRLFAAMAAGNPFDMDQARKPVDDLAVLQQWSATAHETLLALADGMTAEKLRQPLHNPRMPEMKSTVGETLMHVVLHSQGHRSQCLARLRELAGEAPTLDFLMWVKLGRPGYNSR